KKEDGLIDWSRSATEIDRCIRGFQPWPNAYTNFNAKGLTIWRAEPVSSVSETVPGEVISAHGDDLLVNCGQRTALRLIEVQPEARKRMPVRDFMNGVRVKIRDRFA